MRRFGAIALALGFAVGCEVSKEPPIQTAPVTGIATLGGKPLEGYRVIFYHVDSPAQQPSSGRVDADGRFSLSTRGNNDGAIIGKNDVWIVYDPDVPLSDPDSPPVKIPPPTVELPEKYKARDTSGITVEVPEEGLTDYKLELE